MFMCTVKMKVILVICLHIVVTWCITVPPTWLQDGRITYQAPAVSTTAVPINKDQVPPSFYPKLIQPAKHVNQLQYRPPNNQQIFVYHPQTNKHTPHSFQIVHFDNQNQDIPIKQHTNQNTVKQHLTEVTRVPNASAPKPNKIKIEEIEHDIPTKPIYPGEGQWAKYGLKHRPYIPQQTKQEHVEDEDSSEEKPEGYETFEKGEQQFKQAENKFQGNIHQLPSQVDESDSEPLYTKPTIGFVPEKLYTQVRHTESEQHLPRSAIDPDQEENAARLREVVKDSRIHTVYTEEGYEDSAYDHAGHEKNAENHEAHEQAAADQSGSSGRSRGRGQGKYAEEGGRRQGGNYVRKRTETDDQSKNENYNNSESYRKKNRKLHDTDTADSNNESNISPTAVPSKHIKTVTMKNGENEDINMEIHTEVKYTPQKMKHKYVKIIPSSGSNREKSLKRVKRYDKEMLSKRYVRKRPDYYWKKVKTTTTLRPLINARKKFEAAFKTQNKLNKPEHEYDLELEESNSSTTEKPVSTTTIKSTTTIRSISTTTVHPDLLNPELTTKVIKPSMPKVLPVKIRKFKIKREKRFTNDFPEIKVDLKEFKDVSKLPDPTQAPDLTHIKYPYYKLPISENLHENSPLRYAEDMANIPHKVENEMSFYKSKDHIVCPEIESTVNPIPERIENQKEGEETDKMAEVPDLPRLKGLGDKIDCLKDKYFGENPLDSPFFQEEIIQDPIPFFTIKNSNKNTMKRELKIKILEPIVVLEEDLMESATVNPIHKSAEAVLKPPYTLMEMMTMNQENIIKIPPKSIYDQISLLEADDDKKSSETESPPSEKFVIVYDNKNVRKAEMISSTSKPQESNRKPQVRKRPVNIVKKLALKKIRKPTITTSTSTTTTTDASTTVNPEPVTQITEAPEKQIQPIRKLNNNWNTANGNLAAFYNIFDISKYLPRVPNHRLLTSQVQDFIKPSVQMKVYSDVIQSINNEKEAKDTSDSKPIAVTIPVTIPKIQNTERIVEIEMTTPSNSNNTYQTNTQVDAVIPQATKHINYFYFLGMQSPDLVQHSISKREVDDLMTEETILKPVTYHRSKRQIENDYNDDLMMAETQNAPVRKPAYTEIVRQRPARPATEDPEDEEDLNPRKRVYELKSSSRSSSTTAEPDIEEEIIEEIVTEPTTTPKPIIYPVEANKNDPKLAEYIFFIDKLHDKWAKEDATSTTEATTTTTAKQELVMTQIAAESMNVRRGEPTYLQIINQLHEVRNEEDAKTSTTTTEVPTTEKYISTSVKNSNPFIHEEFMSELNSMKAKLDPDFNSDASRNRNYSARFKTNIDTSKYKTIERAPVTIRHNMSSRFNAEDQVLPLEKEKTTKTPMIIAIIRPYSTETPDSEIQETTNIPEKPSTTTVKTRLRNRTRGRSSYTTSATTVPSTSSNPNFRRRRPTRLTTTTTASPTTLNANYRRRSKPKATESQSLTTEPPVVIVTPVNSKEVEEPKTQRRFQKVQERRVTSEVTLTRFYDDPSSSEEDSSEEKKHQYEVVTPLKNSDLHGGNYKHEDELTTLSDIPVTFYNDPDLAQSVNTLKESADVSTEKSNLLPQKEIEEKADQKPVQSKVNLYPNMARMVNRLADSVTTVIQEDVEEETEKPLFIKDPSRRMYYYAKL